MTIKSPLYLQNLTYSATDDRRLISALLPGVGVIQSADLAVSQHSTGNMSVDVAAGSAVIEGTALANQQNYLFTSDATVNLTIATAPGSGQSRIDLIVATIEDQDQDGGTNNQGVLQVVKGTAASTGSQVAPSAPASSLVLAHIAVGPSVTSILTANITDERSLATSFAPAPDAARIYQSSSQNISNNSNTSLTNFTKDYAQGLATVSVGGTGEIIIGTPGVYDIRAQVKFNVGSYSTVQHRFSGEILKNGSTVLVDGEVGIPFATGSAFTFGSTAYVGIPMVTDARLAAADVLSLAAFTLDGFNTAAVPTQPGTADIFLSARFVSR